MDGVRWNEVYESFKLPAYTLLHVSATDNTGRTVTDLFFDDFVRALAHYARMVERKEVVSAYLTAYRIKHKGLEPLDLLNRSGFAVSDPITISTFDRAKERASEES